MADNLDLALRIRADVQSAIDHLRGVAEAVDRLGKEAGEAARGADRLGKEAGEAARGADRLGKEAGEAARGVDRLGKEAGEAARGVDRLGRAGGREGFFGRNLQQLISGNVIAQGITRIAGAAKQMAVDVVRAGVDLRSIRDAMRAVTDDSASAARELAFVAGEAERLGIDLEGAERAFVSLTAAARGTALEGQGARDVFTAVAEASRVMGLTAEQQSGALTAIEQIISKGKVSAEELRGQLGERLPGAFQIAARAMGVTTAELDEMLAAGELLADDFLPRFARELRQTFSAGVEDAARGPAAAFQRLDNAILDLQRSIADSGLVDFFADLARGIADTVKAAREGGEEIGLFAGRTAARRIELAQARRIDAAAVINAAVAQLARPLEPGEKNLQIMHIRRLRRSRPDLSGEELIAAASEAAFSGLSTTLRDSIRARIDRAREEIRIQTEIIRREGGAPDARPGSRGVRRAPAGRGVDDPVSGPASETIDRLARLRVEAEDRYARETLSRLQLLDREHRRQLAEIESVKVENAEEEQARDDALAALRRAHAEERKALEQQIYEEGLAAVDRASRAHRRAAAEIGDALASPYGRAVREARRWRNATLDALDETAEGYDALAAGVEEVFRGRIAAAAREAADEQARASERALRSASDWRSGVERGLRDLARGAENYASLAERAVTGAFQGMEDALTRLVSEGKLSFRSLADSILSDLARIAVRQSITGPLYSALAAALGGRYPGGAGAELDIGARVGHAGGIVGALGTRRSGIAPSAFAGARRLHAGGLAGIRADEVPAILRRGEGVFTPEQMRALSPAAPAVTVNVVNQGTPQRVAEQGPPRIDAGRMILDVVVEDIAAGGRIPRVLAASP